VSALAGPSALNPPLVPSPGAAATAAILVALVAIHAVVDVPLDALMFAIGLTLRMAVRAGEHRIIIGIRVARRAISFRSAVVHVPPRVIELAIRPLDRVMAGRARCREVRRHVIRIGRRIILSRVAGEAIGIRNVVVVVNVAVRAHARRHLVRIRQRPARLAVVKLPIAPLQRVVTHFACRWEFRRHVIRILRLVVVVLVAAHARRVRDVVVVVDVAVRARPRRHRMRIRQRPARLAVVKLPIAPLQSVMAEITRR